MDLEIDPIPVRVTLTLHLIQVEGFCLTIIVGMEHDRVPRKRDPEFGDAKVGVGQVKVALKVVESPRSSLTDVQDDAGGQRRVDGALDSAIDGKRGVLLVGPGTYDDAAATNPFCVCCK